MTIKDLSARTGYSVGTISRVLNNQPNVSQRAKDTILRAAEECGFQLNANAKQLKQQHGSCILAVVKGISNELFGRLVEALQARMADSRYPLVVDYVDEDSNEVRRALQLCLEKKPLGILFLGGNQDHFLADFDKIHVPCVLVTNDAGGLNFPNLSSVSSDNDRAARMAIEHLAGLGHRRIAVIGGDPQVSDTTRQRYAGCMEAFREYGIEFDEKADYESIRFSYSDGYRAVQDLLARGREFTALFAMADVMAIGAIRALQDAGKRVPEDVSVVGFDGLTISRYIVPRLATIRQDVDLLAEHSLDLLMRNISGENVTIHEAIPVQLIQGESATHPAGM